MNDHLSTTQDQIKDYGQRVAKQITLAYGYLNCRVFPIPGEVEWDKTTGHWYIDIEADYAFDVGVRVCGTFTLGINGKSYPSLWNVRVYHYEEGDQVVHSEHYRTIDEAVTELVVMEIKERVRNCLYSEGLYEAEVERKQAELELSKPERDPRTFYCTECDLYSTVDVCHGAACPKCGGTFLFSDSVNLPLTI